MEAKTPPFIPPVPLVFAQGMLLLSWIALFGVGASGSFGLSPLSLVWIHAVALGWITTTALAFMIHVVPAFTDVEWRFHAWARGAITAFLPGVLLLLAGFYRWYPPLLIVGGAIVLGALAAFGFTFLATVAPVLSSPDRTTRAIARAFILVIAALVTAVLVGFFISVGLEQGTGNGLRFAAIHGTIGVVGWIALLVAGVSARTFNRLIGRADRRRVHVATSTTAFLGLCLWVAGEAAGLKPAAIAGGIALVASALLFAASTLWALRNASNQHRLPREFLLASAVWLAVAACFGAANLAGFDFGAAMLYALLAGWVGQTINSHIMHTGVRVLATIVINDDDETDPIDLLNRRLGLASLLFNQFAVLLGTLGLSLHVPSLLEIAALSGIGAMAFTALNVVHAATAARRVRDAERRSSDRA